MTNTSMERESTSRRSRGLSPAAKWNTYYFCLPGIVRLAIGAEHFTQPAEKCACGSGDQAGWVWDIYAAFCSLAAATVNSRL